MAYSRGNSKVKVEISLRTRALRLLARREHSRVELERKLAPHATDPAELSELLADLERHDWMSERRVVEQVTASRRRRFGSQRIAHELREKGIGLDAIAAAVSGLRESELDAARQVWRTKFSSLPASASERARQVRFLQYRGFSFEIIKRVLKGGADDE